MQLETSSFLDLRVPDSPSNCRQGWTEGRRCSLAPTMLWGKQSPETPPAGVVGTAAYRTLYTAPDFLGQRFGLTKPGVQKGSGMSQGKDGREEEGRMGRIPPLDLASALHG